MRRSGINHIAATVAYNIPETHGAAKANASCPRAAVKLLAECGHFPMTDDPGAFAAALIDFATPLMDEAGR